MSSIELTRRQPLRANSGILSMGHHLWAFFCRWDLLWHMTVRHLRGQYKQSVLGYAWAFVNPLSQMIILSFVFATIMRVGSGGDEPYALFLFVGLLPWIFFSAAISSATESVVGAA